MTEMNKAIVNAKKDGAVKARRRDVLQLRGPLFVDPKYLRKGFSPRWVDVASPGNIEVYSKLGYTVVKKDEVDMQVGDMKPSDSSRFGSAVTAQSKDGHLMVLMEIPQDIFDEIEAEKEEENRNVLHSVTHTIDGIDADSQYGEVKLGKK